MKHSYTAEVVGNSEPGQIEVAVFSSWKHPKFFAIKTDEKPSVGAIIWVHIDWHTRNADHSPTITL